jgi:hypothetical protein
MILDWNNFYQLFVHNPSHIFRADTKFRDMKFHETSHQKFREISQQTFAKFRGIELNI